MDIKLTNNESLNILKGGTSLDLTSLFEEIEGLRETIEEDELVIAAALVDLNTNKADNVSPTP